MDSVASDSEFLDDELMDAMDNVDSFEEPFLYMVVDLSQQWK